MLDLALSDLALTLLAARGADRAGPRADASVTASTLTAQGYTPHEAVLAFEADYGGLRLFESDPEAPALVVGLLVDERENIDA